MSGWILFIPDSVVKGRKAEGCDDHGDGDGDAYDDDG